MDFKDQHRPPRSTRPGGPQISDQTQYSARPPSQNVDPGRGGVSFQTTEQGDRHMALDPNRPRAAPTAWNQARGDPEGGADGSRVGRKKSLVRPDREKIEPGHRQWHYRAHADSGRVGVMPSTTGNLPQRGGLRRGRSILGREEDVHESGLALFKRTATLRRKRPTSAPLPTPPTRSRGCMSSIPGPHNAWMMYCWLITACIPAVLLRSCGLYSAEQQRAWREKMGLIGIILLLMAGVGFLTFGFTKAVCNAPPSPFPAGSISKSSVIIHGLDYDFSKFNHPRAGTTFDGKTNPLLVGGWNLGGNDASFMFQKVNDNCLGLITKASTSSITGSGSTLNWYFPCNIFNQFGTSGVNLTGYESPTSCHTSATARNLLAQAKPLGQVFYSWEQVQDPKRNLAVFESAVLDLNLLQWLNKAQVNYPRTFDAMMKPTGEYNGKDLTMLLVRTNQRKLGHCLQDIITVGFIDTKTIGCVASEVVLYLSLVFIIGVVAIRFGMAVMFAWFFSWKLGTFPQETYQQRMQRSAEIENWTSDIYRAAPSQYRPNVKSFYEKKDKRKTFLPSTSRFTPADIGKSGSRPLTTFGTPDPLYNKRSTVYGAMAGKGGNKLTPPDSPSRGGSRSTIFGDMSSSKGTVVDSVCPFPLLNVVPQPSPDYEPFNFPLAHTICLVTAYSESVEGLRTTLDSLATTDYPNSHKVILVIADGLVKGSGNDMTTPEIVLSMMKEFVISPSDVEPHSYVAIADGHKRHNMAKVYAGFYDYDDATIERSKQQRVPIVLVSKCGNPMEASDSKPGNRGKRDSQIVLMAFLQKVMFDERMTTFEYEFFNSLWRVTGVSPDRYELVLCVDADTKVFPDSLTRMVSCMVHDPEIMGLCGETKIANKAETFVTMMQVFEYYISHHMTKAFESMFGGVTCLPGCFSMYRIKAPKGDSDYWVPILANPDIVEHYSENVVDTLHKKNLLLLGEDRYLTTLMLKTFPKRKNMFCPQAVCKTVVPDTFRVLLSQRRRWINSTIHNLAELLLVRDLCGTFCFSMQFIVGMELAGTLVLPAAITFTIFLIIDSAIPGGSNTVIPLVLLGIVLGLPGLLIVITSRKIAYVGWMLIYLLSLPIWNGVLPAYAFWHFDDFTWGQTRRVEGDAADNTGDKDGEFDSSHIVMKRWAEFERDRRWKDGTPSRDSLYDSKRATNRYSTTSYSDTYNPESRMDSSAESTLYTSTSPARSRHDSAPLLMLPAPLAVNQHTPSASSRSSEDAYMSDPGSNPNNRLLSPTSQSPYAESPSEYTMPQPRYPTPGVASMEGHLPGPDGQPTAIRSAVVPSPYPGETRSPVRQSMQPQPVQGGYEEPHRAQSADLGGRGVRLMDSGPVPGPEGAVRRVSRPGRRNSSQPATQNRYSRPVSNYNLPPGAAPPQPGYNGSS